MRSGDDACHHEKGVPSRAAKRLIPSLAALLFSFVFVSAAPLSAAPLKMPVYLVIGAIMVFLIVVGMSARVPFLTIVGFLAMIILGWTMQSGGLLVKVGVNETVMNSTTTAVDVYEPFDYGNYHVLGLFLTFIGIMGTIFASFATIGGSSDG